MAIPRFFVAIVSWFLFTSPVFGQFQEKPISNEPEIRSLILNSNYTKLPTSLSGSWMKIDQHAAFFCRQEKALQENIKFPIRFRLGEWNYTQQLEGKGFLHWPVNNR